MKDSKMVKLTEAQWQALAWLADKPDGRALYAAMPEEIARAVLQLRPLKCVREFRGISNFTGAQLTPAGRAMLATRPRDGEGDE